MRIYDHKFGYHILWIAPLLYIGAIIGIFLIPFRAVARSIKNYRHRLNVRKREKRNPELKRLRELAGIKQPDV
jgi:hypothetical protein